MSNAKAKRLSQHHSIIHSPIHTFTHYVLFISIIILSYIASITNQIYFLWDDSPTMLSQFENHVSCLLLTWEK